MAKNPTPKPSKTAEELRLDEAREKGVPWKHVRARADDERIDRVFRLNMGIFKLKFSRNFLMNLSTQLQIIGALAVGVWAVLHDQLEIGGVVAFISGIGRITDPWGDLVNYFRDANINQVKFGLLRDASISKLIAVWN